MITTPTTSTRSETEGTKMNDTARTNEDNSASSASDPPQQVPEFSCSFSSTSSNYTEEDEGDCDNILATPPTSPDVTTPTSSLTTFSKSALSPPCTGATRRLSSLASSSPTPRLGSNMMYERKNRDPLAYYQVLEVIGVGSMGSVSRVKKRSSAVGGSARLENSKRGKQTWRWPSLFSSCYNNDNNSTNHCFGNKFVNLFSRNDNHYETSTSAIITHDNDILALPTLDHLSDSQHHHIQLSASSHHSAISTSSAPKKIEYALKSIHLQRLTRKAAYTELQNEIHILKTLDHPHIVKAIETFEHHSQIFLVMEMCKGGDLYSRDPYTEEESARIIGSVLSAIKYMHGRGVVHRDLKFENIMFVSQHPQAEVKLIDFGLSAKYGPEDPVMKDGVGTIYTMAPEVLKGKYTSQADIWSIGVLTYMLLSSQVPFYGTKRREIAGKIKRCEYDFKGRRWAKISPQAKQFVSELLLVDPTERPTASEASKSAWLNRRFAATARSPDDNELDNIQATLQNFAAYSKLKKLALMVVAHKSTSEEIGFLRKAFEKYDENHDGFIDLREFQDALQLYGYNEEEIIEMFRGANIDCTGSIKYTEFLAATIEAHGAINEERLAEAFDRLDTDDSGFITAENLRDLLGDDLPLFEIQSIIAECNLKDDNQISYEEFLGLWDQHQDDHRTELLRQISIRRSSVRSLDREHIDYAKQIALSTSSHHSHSTSSHHSCSTSSHQSREMLSIPV